MPKNKGKGGKNRRRGKNENETEKRELVFKEDGQEYAQVTKMLGNGRLEAMCFDGVKRLCHIRGKLRKKIFLNLLNGILLHTTENNTNVIIGGDFNVDSAKLLRRMNDVLGWFTMKRTIMEPTRVTAASGSCIDYFLVWINQGDIILIGLRDYQDAKADVILKYTPDEARNLKTYGEFPESVRINETVTFVEEGFDEDIEFGDDISSADEADPVDGI